MDTVFDDDWERLLKNADFSDLAPEIGEDIENYPSAEAALYSQDDFKVTDKSLFRDSDDFGLDGGFSAFEGEKSIFAPKGDSLALLEGSVGADQLVVDKIPAESGVAQSLAEESNEALDGEEQNIDMEKIIKEIAYRLEEELLSSTDLSYDY